MSSYFQMAAALLGKRRAEKPPEKRYYFSEADIPELVRLVRNYEAGGRYSADNFELWRFIHVAIPGLRYETGYSLRLMHPIPYVVERED